MLSHVTIGTNDPEKARAFYTDLLGLLGAKPMPGVGERINFVRSPGEPVIVLTRPIDGQAATVGNGSTVGLACKDKAQVRAVYDKAMALGAASEGEVGPRGNDDEFYGGYFRDLDGNKLAVITMNR